MKNMFKRLFNLTCALAMVVYMFSPLTVLAVGETQSLIATFEVEDSTKYSLSIDQGRIRVSEVGGTSSTLIDILSNGADVSTEVTASCATTTTCTVNMGTKSTYSVRYSSMIDITEGSTLVNEQLVYDQNKTFSIKPPANQNPPSGGGQGGVPHPNFNGETILFWACGNKTCYHQFNDMHVVNSGEYIRAADITADNVPGETFDIFASTKFFADPTRALEYLSQHNINQNEVTDLDITTLVGPDGIDYQPVGEPYLNNAYVSYADRNFKAIIYNDNFAGISVGSLAGLTYYPGAWQNELTRQDAYDLSNTTKDEPVEIHTVLLESKINLKGLSYNGFAIKSIEALDVPDDAVTITKKSDDSYDFEFSSRFYDKVVFKVTGTDNKVYYMRIKREAIALNTMHVDGGKFRVYGELYYDKAYSWTDFEVTAKIVYKNGTFELKKMENANWLDDGLGNSENTEENDEENPVRPEWPVGKGLKRAGMKLDFTQEEIKNIDYIYVNVTYKGSTANDYKGAYVGSGKGEVLDLREAR